MVAAYRAHSANLKGDTPMRFVKSLAALLTSAAAIGLTAGWAAAQSVLGKVAGNQPAEYIRRAAGGKVHEKSNSLAPVIRLLRVRD